MNKGQLVSTFATTTGAKNADAKTAVEAFATIVKDALMKGDEVTIPGVGKLKVHQKAARAGRNPATGEAISIPAKRVVKFTPATEFSDKFTLAE